MVIYKENNNALHDSNIHILQFNPSSDNNQAMWLDYLESLNARLTLKVNWKIELFNPGFDKKNFYLVLDNNQPIGSISGQVVKGVLAKAYGNISHFYLHRDYSASPLPLKMIRMVSNDLKQQGIKEIFTSFPETERWKFNALALQSFTTIDIETFMSHNLENIPPRGKDRTIRITPVKNIAELREAVIINNACFADSNLRPMIFEEMHYLVQQDKGFSLRQFLIARTKRNDVGVIHYFIEEDIGCIYGLGVKPYYRDRPIAEELVWEALRRIKTDNAVAAHIGATAGSLAQALYEKCNFVVFQNNLVMRRAFSKSPLLSAKKL